MSMMKKMLVGGVVLLGATMGVQAHEAGDVLVRFGAATVAPNDDSSTVELNGAPVVAGGEAQVDSDTQLGLTVAYMLTNNVGIELLAASPFQHKITANDALGSAVTSDLGDTKHLPPTVSVQYYFNNTSNITPYVGVGVNYTAFFGEDASSELEAALGSEIDLDLENSWGLAAQAGVDVALANNWMLNAAVWYIDIDTDATFTLESTGAKITSDVTIDPWVYQVGVGYKF